MVIEQVPVALEGIIPDMLFIEHVIVQPVIKKVLYRIVKRDIFVPYKCSDKLTFGIIWLRILHMPIVLVEVSVLLRKTSDSQYSMYSLNVNWILAIFF